jgi:hypothetical protein
MPDDDLDFDTDEGLEEEELTPFARSLMGALESVVSQLRKDELLEMEDDRVEALVLEATRAGADAASPKQLIKKVRKALIDSEHVEEVYATDRVLDDVLKSKLDG